MIETDGDRFSRISEEARDLLCGLSAGVMDESISVALSKKANVLAGKINASCRRFSKSLDPVHLVAAEMVLGELKVVLAVVGSADVAMKKGPV